MDIRCANPYCCKLHKGIKPGSKASIPFHTALDCRYPNQTKAYFCPGCYATYKDMADTIDCKLRGDPGISLDEKQERLTTIMYCHPGFSTLTACQWAIGRMTDVAMLQFPIVRSC